MGQGFLLSFTSIFVALDVIGGVPMYLSMTQHLPANERKRVVNASMLVALIVALMFMFLGQGVLKFLGITLSDFQIAGGLILLLIAIADLTSGPDSLNHSSGQTGVVPLGVPLITGPAVITALILEAGSRGLLVTFLSLAANYAIAWFALSQCERIQRWIGKDGTVILSKIAALFLCAIAISMMRSGIFQAIRTFSAGLSP